LPLYPAAHVHTYAAVRSLHVPPFWHGMDAQSSTFIEQVSPAQPAEQLHANAPCKTAGIVEFDESVQPPPF
jgi:hypothetical protein